MLKIRTWAGPVLIGTFIVVTVTGILMFFRINYGFTRDAHKWLSWALTVAAIAHVILNWKPFLAYFRKPVGSVLILISLLLGGLSFLPGSSPGRRPFMETFKAIEQAPLSLVAQLAKRTPEDLTNELRAGGLNIQDDGQTLKTIAEQNKIQNVDLLNRIFCKNRSLSNDSPSRK